jgi:hypothetical protein
MTLVLVLAAALAPALALRYISGAELSYARDRWLMVVLALGVVILAPAHLWLAVLAFWHLCAWPRMPAPWTIRSSVVTWSAIGATWWVLRSIPRGFPFYFDAIAAVWIGFALVQVLLLVIDRQRTTRPKGSFGSPANTAMYIALVAPFMPGPGWLLLSIGLYLTWSWLAFLGVAAGLVWLYPSAWPYVAASGLSVAILWLWSPSVAGRRLFNWTPRSDSMDSILSRLWVWRMIPRELTRTGTWLLGMGPDSMKRSSMRWMSQYGGIELPCGDAFCEPLQLLYEYGVVGFLGGLAFVATVAPHLRLGDPWSAAWITGLVLSLGHNPFRNPPIGLTFLAISAEIVR